MTDLSAMDSPWFGLIQRHRQRRRIEKNEVLDLLASDAPVPDAAKPFLMAVIQGAVKFPRGKKPVTDGFDASLATGLLNKHLLLAQIAAIESELEQEQGTTRLLGEETPREQAKCIMAKQMGVSIRTLEGLIKDPAE